MKSPTRPWIRGIHAIIPGSMATILMSRTFTENLRMKTKKKIIKKDPQHREDVCESNSINQLNYTILGRKNNGN